jgi:pimeloyl-ACP methyl ester carboxylesterase
MSSGAALALRAAAKLGAARAPKLALYEPPFNSDDEKDKQDFAKFSQRMSELIAANQRGDAVAFFMGDEMPAEMIEDMRKSPEWPIMEAVAHTLAYDNAVMGDGAVSIEAARAAAMPSLVMHGGERQGEEFFHAATQATAAALPNGQYLPLTGQPHAPVAPEVLIPVLDDISCGMCFSPMAAKQHGTICLRQSRRPKGK